MYGKYGIGTLYARLRTVPYIYMRQGRRGGKRLFNFNFFSVPIFDSYFKDS